MAKNLVVINCNYVFAGIFVMISVIIGHFFIINPFQASIVWPAIGFALGFSLYYGYKVMPYIGGGYFLGYFIALFLVGESDIVSYLVVPVLLSISPIIAIYSGLLFGHKLGYNNATGYVNMLKLLCIAILVSVMTSISGNLFYIIIDPVSISYILESLWVWFLGDVFSVFIFGIPLFYAFHYDKSPLPTRFTRVEVFYIFGFIIFTFLFFLNLIPIISFEDHKFVFSIFALIIAFRFPYRTAYLFSLLFLCFLVLFPPVGDDVSHISYMLDVNLFLLVLTTMVFVIKHYLARVQNDDVVINEKSKRLERLVDAMYRLLSFSSQYNKPQGGSIDNQVKMMFETVYTIFDKADYGTCMIVNDYVHYITGFGYDIDQLNAFKIDAGDFSSSTTDPIVIRDAEVKLRTSIGKNYSDYTKNNPMIKESIYVGLQLSNDVVCEMSFDLDIESKKAFDKFDLEFFKSLQKLFNSFYESETVGSENDELMNDIVLSLLRTLELFDKDIGLHSMDVALLTQSIARRSDLPDTEINDLYWAGIVHDIGKLGIDENIVRKEGVLTVAEYEAMQKHSRLGYDVLKESESLKQIAYYVLHHHEWVDGSGYPERLKGEAIPLGSKILHVAEAVSTMMRNQSYSVEKLDDVIIEELIKYRNIQFDGDCVDITIGLIKDGELNRIKKQNIT